MNRTEEIKKEFETVMSSDNIIKRLAVLEKAAYTHLQDFYADEDEEFEEAYALWEKIVKAKRRAEKVSY